jgi:tricorn protease interacting factor F2/3
VTEARDPAPSDYRLRLDVDFANQRWKGTVEFDLAGTAGSIRLDAERLRVTAAREGGRPTTYTTAPEGGGVSIQRTAGSASPIAVDFEGEIDSSALFGFYRSRAGTGYVLTTHCEPTGARRIFPCVDRPDRKARLHLTVRAPSDLEVITNTEPESTRPVDGAREWVFGATPPMSTYLFYLGLGKFDRVEDRSGRVAVRVLTPPGRAEAGRFALGAAVTVLRAYEEYYGIPYPLPKLDLVAVEEHAFGAMENWGAISFQETRLLFDASSSSFSARDVFQTVAHEIAHQWFGNLVTMAWWDDIWLNESFAALMETMITAKARPATQPWDDFFLRRAGMAEALSGDSLRSTHPVHVPVERPDEMSQIFDEISYGKGSSVLAMLHRYLGEEKFRAGVTDYLRRFAYGNARTEDLWNALGRSSGEPVAAIAGPWIGRAGLPVIAARIGPRGVELEQRQYRYLGSQDAEPWPITMVLDVDGRPQTLRWDTRTCVVPTPPMATVHLNPGGVGFYRVRYDATLSERLLRVLPSRPPADRWVVLSDLMAFLLSGDVDWPTFERFARTLGATNDRLVVEPLGAFLTNLALSFPRATSVQELARSVLAGAVTRIGLDRRPDEPPVHGVLRDRLSFARVRVDPAFAAELSGRFARWGELDPDLRPAVAVARAREGGAEGYRELRRAFDGATVDAESARLARGLSWSSEPELVRETLELAISGRLSRSHIFQVIHQASLNPGARAMTWAWLVERLGRLDELFRGSGYLALVLELALPELGLGRPEAVREFFASHAYPEGTRGVEKGLERLEILERLGPRLTDAPAP